MQWKRLFFNLHDKMKNVAHQNVMQKGLRNLWLNCFGLTHWSLIQISPLFYFIESLYLRIFSNVIWDTYHGLFYVCLIRETRRRRGPALLRFYAVTHGRASYPRPDGRSLQSPRWRNSPSQKPAAQERCCLPGQNALFDTKPEF